MIICDRHRFGFWPGCKICEAGRAAGVRTEMREALQATVESMLLNDTEPDPEKRIDTAADQINDLIERHLIS